MAVDKPSQVGGGTPARSQSSTAGDPTCHVCKKATKRSVAVSCVTCGNTGHVACLVSGFVTTNGGANKSGTQWLADFLNNGNFRYVCQQCVENKSTSSSQQCPAADADSGKQQSLLSSAEATQLRGDIAALQSSVQALAKQLSELKPAIASQPAASQENSKPSYSSMVSSNITSTVRQAVTESFNRQRKVERISATVAVHSLPDNGRDYKDLHELLVKLQCDVKVLSCFRIGHFKSGSKPRLLKVELPSAGDREDVIEAAKKLRDSEQTSKIRIVKWLPREEMDKMKQLWKECEDSLAALLRAAKRPGDVDPETA